MATFKDAQAGWSIFRDYDFTLSLEEINQRLIGDGFAPVALRTYSHYQKLRRYGYDHYIPINQLDVKTLQNLVWDVSSRNRYPLIETRIPLLVRVQTRDGSFEFRGQGVQISEGSLAVRIRQKGFSSPFRG